MVEVSHFYESRHVHLGISPHQQPFFGEVDSPDVTS